MASIIGVETLQHTNGTTAATVTSSGKLGVPTLAHTNGTTAATIDTAGRILQPTKPAFMARRNGGGVTLTNQVFPFDTVSAEGGFNIGGHYNTSTYRFTCPVAGVYFFSFITVANSSSTDAQIKLRKNGSDFHQTYGRQPDTEWNTHHLAIHANAAASDYFDIYINNSLGVYGNSWAAFSGHLVG